THPPNHHQGGHVSTTRRRTRTVALAAGASLLAAPGTAAAEAPPGQGAPPEAAEVLGASPGTGELLRLRLGADALDLHVLTEASETINDPAGGVVEAVERLTALGASSSAVPGVDALATPPVETRSQGEEESVAAEDVDLAERSAAGP